MFNGVSVWASSVCHSNFYLLRNTKNFLAVIAPLALVIGSFKLPESPRFQMTRGQEAEALDLLIKLHHSKDDPQNIMAREEFTQIKRQLEADARMPKGIAATLKVPSYLKRFLLGIFVQ